MAVATYDLGAVGSYTAVSVTCDGDITAVKRGGPGGAYEFTDAQGDRATVKVNGQEAQSVFSTIAKADVDAIVTATNAATP